MKKAIINHPFSVVQWHGDEYPYYEEDAKNSMFNVGDEFLVLKEAASNPMGKLFVVFNEKTNESTVVADSYLDFNQ